MFLQGLQDCVTTQVVSHVLKEVKLSTIVHLQCASSLVVCVCKKKNNKANF